MSLTIYIETNKVLSDGKYTCLLWTEPTMFGDEHTDNLLRMVPEEDLATLGFPKPGKVRTIAIGECEEADNEPAS